jgi:nicotinate-nucleotide--dimethylbenzimidazole phosphoribosyltransferase
MIINEALKQQITDKINNKTKPLGALGMLETIALQVALIQNTDSPAIKNPTIIVFAADHGIAATGLVNPFPQAVTAQMVLNFAAGGAAINVFCTQSNIALQVVDAGVNYNFEPTLLITHAKIAHGTADYNQGPAATSTQISEAILKGENIVNDLYKSGCNTVAFGEMGIGNTSSASLIMHHYTALPVDACVGRGTGANDDLLRQKIATLEAVATKHELKNLPATELLCRIGGFEIAMMVGAYKRAYELNMVILVDGFIATAALMIANSFYPNNELANHCIYAHTSNENAHAQMLTHLKATPILQLGLRLGEGTGAAIALPIVQSAVAFLNNMASFESASVSTQTN